MSRILAIDPGPEVSAFLVWDGALHDFGFLANADIRAALLKREIQADRAAIEMVACYGMPVGAETFDTCRWIGRFEEVLADTMPVRLVFRREVKMHLCNSARAKDGNIRQALIDKHGQPGTKKNPGRLYGISSHLWAALGVADYALENP